MFRYRFRQPGSRYSYELSQDRAEHWIVTERDGRTGAERRYRTTWGAVQTILALPEAARFHGVLSLYHYTRQLAAEKSRKSDRQGLNNVEKSQKQDS